MVPPDRYEVVGEGDLDDALLRSRRAAFASMDLPPSSPTCPSGTAGRKGSRTEASWRTSPSASGRRARAAGEAFDLMREATATELRENVERDTDPTWIRTTRVSPLGERTWFDDF